LQVNKVIRIFKIKDDGGLLQSKLFAKIPHSTSIFCKKKKERKQKETWKNQTSYSRVMTGFPCINLLKTKLKSSLNDAKLKQLNAKVKEKKHQFFQSLKPNNPTFYSYNKTITTMFQLKKK